jgi:capsular polysaccharide biosynthesis protein
MDLRYALTAIRRMWLVVILVMVALAGLAAVMAQRTVPKYAATARGVVSVSRPDARPPSVLTSGSMYILARLTSYARLGTSSRVLDSVADELGLARTGQALRDRVVARNEVGTAFLDVTVADHDPATAARIADATMRQLATVVTDLESGAVTLTPTGPAATASTPVGPPRPLVVGLGTAGGAVAGAVLAVLAQLARDRRRVG